MGDHSRFIFHSLSPTETQFIMIAQEFILQFDQFLETVKRQMSASEVNDFQRQVYDLVEKFREFKLQLLDLSIATDLKTHLTPSFINDMVNELEEYLLIMNHIDNEKSIYFHPIHYHLLWLTDAVGHAASLAAEMDFVEKELVKKSLLFNKVFQDLNTKAIIMNGYLRTNQKNFPALERLNEQVALTIYDFMEFLENIRDQRIDGRVLGTLMPIMADHMAREECYYLWKLSEVSHSVRKPKCDPTRPRIET